MENRSIRWIIRLSITLLAGLVLVMFVQVLTFLQPLWLLLGKVVLPFFLSALIAYLLHPIVHFLEKRNIPRTVSILLIYALFLSGFAWLLLRGTPYVMREGQELLEQLPEMADTYRSFVHTIHEQTEVLPPTFQAEANEWMKTGEEWIADSITNVAGFLRSLLDWLVLLAVIPFLVFYLLKDIPLVKKTVWYLTPDRARKGGIRLAKEIDESLGNYIRGQLIVCLAVGILAYIGFWIIDMPYALLLAGFIGLTNIIPYFGPIIGVIPVVFIALTESFELVLLGIVVNLIVQVIEGNVLAPIIVGKTLHMHPVLIIFALIVGGEVAGVPGLILSVPVMTVLRVVILHVRKMIQERRGVY
ncbi:Predicted PurR-regulated permease PerM [Evansella caseinilytica]|uniref:Predicted PurR-regulated permease PerM n=1 Tax=Evansella caseinilytica TaxID=1503961 RepID=A0A1H3K9B4_9BACI|nr:AI-2E family transporter [Evansella caseinilytica]SDY48787.1 Predicted PurR-regulated permease PerM [Evansella caseinilytica]